VRDVGFACLHAPINHSKLTVFIVGNHVLFCGWTGGNTLLPNHKAWSQEHKHWSHLGKIISLDDKRHEGLMRIIIYEVFILIDIDTYLRILPTIFEVKMVVYSETP